MWMFKNQGRVLLLAVMGFAVSASAQQKGTFTDGRDGQTYKTVKIGNQTWTAENLRFKVGDSWCYENNADNCKKYGMLYDKKMAAIACPKGWHLPRSREWDELKTMVGSTKTVGKKLKSTSGWYNFIKERDSGNGNGTNDYGFSALPGGFCDTSGDCKGLGANGVWWEQSDFSSEDLFGIFMSNEDDGVGEALGKFKEDKSFSVRCIADN